MKKTLMVGNDINNIDSSKYSWEKLIENLIKEFTPINSVEYSKRKPFPLFYEEIFLQSLSNSICKVEKERQIKDYIADKVKKIKPNEIHQMIREFSIENIITTNYEFSLEGIIPEKNNGIIDETRYSIFRHYDVEKKKYWHIHGDCNSPNTINLGFEQYIGQTQHIRNYIVSGTNYKNKSIAKEGLIHRLNDDKIQSWLDLFFKTNIYIIGLSLDFVETDLWWLLTYRARQMKNEKINGKINNNIFYFIPKELIKNKDTNSKEKVQLLKTVGVNVIEEYSRSNGKKEYYNDVLKFVKEGRH